MATPQTRDEFKAWCLRELGDPVICINVSDDQVEDRVDDALDYFRDFHYDGTEHTYLKHQITASDKANRYVTVPEEISGITGVFPAGNILGSSNMFSLKYQISMNEIQNWSSSGMSYYAMSMERLNMIQEMFVGKQPIRFNRHTDKMHLDMDWDVLNVGDYIVIDCYRTIDPETYEDVWSDRWLRRYTTQLIKQQWGNNLKKFVGMQLPGGVTFNGEQIYQEATEEIKRLEEEAINTYSLPAYDMIG